MTMPCLGCDKRYLGCHDHCEEYKHAKAEAEKAKKKRKEETEFTRAILPTGKVKIVREIGRRKK